MVIRNELIKLLGWKFRILRRIFVDLLINTESQ